MYVDEKALPEAAPVKKLAKWQEDCLRAADYIDEHGWCQGKNKNESGAVCLAGALAAITLGNPMGLNTTDLSARHEFDMAYNKIHRKLGITPWVWNDDEKASEEKVTTLLRSMAD